MVALRVTVGNSVFIDRWCRSTISSVLIGPGTELKRLHSDEKVNHAAIKHNEMVSGMVYTNSPMVPAGV